mgnify:CR=1 FL=1
MNTGTTLIEKDPLSLNRIKEINRCEAEFWKRSSGERVASSTDILGFECGSEQWVLEVAFKCGTRTDPDLSDIDFVQGLLEAIEETGVPAHAPIEQRWTSRSTALMSPAHSSDADDLFSWVGIILYVALVFEFSLSIECVTVSRLRHRPIRTNALSNTGTVRPL